jgi:tetratricopeptide (TPR) repeat protein
LLSALKDPSPLIRSSAAATLGDHPTPEVIEALLGATADDYRLVRIRAAASLAGLPAEPLKPPDRQAFEKATADFLLAMTARPDDSSSHYNLGNFHMQRQDFAKAITSFETAIRLQPDSLPPLINISLVFNATGRNDQAEASLRQALKFDPGNAAANLNLGMLLAELARPDEAESAFRAAFKTDPASAVAAYNLGILLAGKKPDEALEWCRKAADLRPQEPRYPYTYAFYLRKTGDTNKAIEVLRAAAEKCPQSLDILTLLADTCESAGLHAEALAIYRQALQIRDLPDHVRQGLTERISSLTPSQ